MSVCVPEIWLNVEMSSFGVNMHGGICTTHRVVDNILSQISIRRCFSSFMSFTPVWYRLTAVLLSSYCSVSSGLLLGIIYLTKLK